MYQNRSVILLTHCPLNPYTTEGFYHQVCLNHDVRQLLKFFVRESAEHIIYLLSFSKSIAYTKAQPYIHRLTRLGTLAAERGKGLAVLRAVSQLIWSGETDGWHEGDHLSKAFAEAGCDLAEMDAVQATEAERLDAVIEANAADQRLGGHYGVPLMVYDGEPFFGQDRYDQLVWRMQQKGSAQR